MSLRVDVACDQHIHTYIGITSCPSEGKQHHQPAARMRWVAIRRRAENLSRNVDIIHANTDTDIQTQETDHAGNS